MIWMLRHAAILMTLETSKWVSVDPLVHPLGDNPGFCSWSWLRPKRGHLMIEICIAFHWIIYIGVEIAEFLGFPIYYFAISISEFQGIYHHCLAIWCIWTCPSRRAFAASNTYIYIHMMAWNMGFCWVRLATTNWPMNSRASDPGCWGRFIPSPYVPILALRNWEIQDWSILVGRD